jgi:hypothetical protein
MLGRRSRPEGVHLRADRHRPGGRVGKWIALDRVLRRAWTREDYDDLKRTILGFQRLNTDAENEDIVRHRLEELGWKREDEG